MQKTVYKLKGFQIFLLIIFIVLFIVNAPRLLEGSISSFISCTLNIVLFFLVLLRHRVAKSAVNIWVILLTIFSIIGVTGILLSIVASETFMENLENLLVYAIIFILCFIIYSYNSNTVIVKNETTEDN